MDPVKEAQTTFAPVLKKWAQGIPRGLKDLQSFERLAEEAHTMYGAGYALGLDPGAEVVATLTGSISGGTPTLRSSPGRSRTRARTRPRTRARAAASGNGAGHPGPTTEQVLTWLQGLGHGATQTEGARHFGVTRQTMAKRYDALASTGQITIEGSGPRKMWRAKELQPA